MSPGLQTGLSSVTYALLLLELPIRLEVEQISMMLLYLLPLVHALPIPKIPASALSPPGLPFQLPPAVQSTMLALAYAAPMPVPPSSQKRIDPNLLNQADCCDRDYTVSCPKGFVWVGDIWGSGKSNIKDNVSQTRRDPGICVADRSRYFGPCADDKIDFTRYSVAAKKQWSEFCVTSWPCAFCPRDYRTCPRGWKPKPLEGKAVCERDTREDSSAFKCEGLVDFVGLSPAVREIWAQACAEAWPCK